MLLKNPDPRSSLEFPKLQAQLIQYYQILLEQVSQTKHIPTLKELSFFPMDNGMFNVLSVSQDPIHEYMD
jgi:hypothetical protein